MQFIEELANLMRTCRSSAASVTFVLLDLMNSEEVKLLIEFSRCSDSFQHRVAAASAFVEWLRLSELDNKRTVVLALQSILNYDAMPTTQALSRDSNDDRMQVRVQLLVSL